MYEASLILGALAYAWAGIVVCMLVDSRWYNCLSHWAGDSLAAALAIVMIWPLTAPAGVLRWKWRQRRRRARRTLA